mgnify:CR=1 FL=1
MLLPMGSLEALAVFFMVFLGFLTVAVCVLDRNQRNDDGDDQ